MLPPIHRDAQPLSMSIVVSGVTTFHNCSGMFLPLYAATNRNGSGFWPIASFRDFVRREPNLIYISVLPHLAVPANYRGMIRFIERVVDDGLQFN